MEIITLEPVRVVPYVFNVFIFKLLILPIRTVIIRVGCKDYEVKETIDCKDKIAP